MDILKEHHKTSVNHIHRIIGQLTALEDAINNDTSCIEISTEMYSVMQSMKGLSKRMFVQSIQNSVIQKPLSESEAKKIDKLIRLIS